jgi:hypothetical protein
VANLRDIDLVISAVKATLPDIAVSQLQVKHPGPDDDGLWFFSHPLGQFEAQSESPDGQLPFLVESDGTERRSQATSILAAAADVLARLGLPPGHATNIPGSADV